jgi:diacylglycerol kinase (ATP)
MNTSLKSETPLELYSMNKMIMIDEVVVIINPNSGKKKSGEILEDLLNIDRNIHYYISNSKKEFDQYLESNIDKYKVFVICGGDGTLNNALKYLAVKPEIILAVLPSGSGDGFANELGFKKDIKNLFKQIESGKTQKVDLIKVNEGYSCNMIGLGIDSHVASEFEHSIKRGLKSYIYFTLKALFNFKPITADITVNNNTIKGVYQMINVANTRQFGNNAYIAPNAKYNDGYLDVVLVKPIPIYLMPLFLIKVFRGTLKASKYIEYIKTDHVKIKSNSKTYHIDGESRLMPTELDISIPQQFNIIKT